MLPSSEEKGRAIITDQKLLGCLVNEAYPSVIDKDKETTPLPNIIP